MTTSYPATGNPDRCPSHPGELIADILPSLGKTKSELASMLDMSRQHFHDIVSARKPVSPVVAAKLGKLFGDGPEIWLRMQAIYDGWHARRDVDVSKIPTLTAA